ncbi:flavin reductase [Micromonospora okii]|uniref:flavin reductase n=1 Tax=Micromonospora okii TaxID=1182970 RepID=UPI001E57D14F|nr:flavin reductase [Micromonospora okii]
MRPLWLCRRCAAPWPCGAARVALLAEYRGNRVGLAVYLAALMTEAEDQLTKLTPATPPADMVNRFLSWVRAPRP